MPQRRMQEAIKGYKMGFKGKQSISKTQRGLIPLSWAAGSGYNVVVNLLLVEDGTDPDLSDSWGWTPLFWVACNGHEAIVKLLLGTVQVKADPKNIWGGTPLLWGTENGHEAIIKLLLATSQVEANLKNSQYGQTLLLRAVQRRQKAIFKLLCEHIN